jgi:hypothetical protein
MKFRQLFGHFIRFRQQPTIHPFHENTRKIRTFHNCLLQNLTPREELSKKKKSQTSRNKRNSQTIDWLQYNHQLGNYYSITIKIHYILLIVFLEHFKLMAFKLIATRVFGFC